jgi:hypothetical protein
MHSPLTWGSPRDSPDNSLPAPVKGSASTIATKKFQNFSGRKNLNNLWIVDVIRVVLLGKFLLVFKRDLKSRQFSYLMEGEGR